MVEMEISSPTTVSPLPGDSILAVASNEMKSDQLTETIPAAKRKRNLPGMPDPDAEVIALSPKTLMATNRFVCEICSKGFQRDQNLQLHLRGHNLPWKLRQRTSKDVRKRVYVCPEANCIHHEPSRALGDLTGIKKHFCRKHGEKKYKCERCSKKYAVQSDCKAHMKTCGSREYRCDCGTLFSRRDSFITHRAFCDALAQEISRPQPPPLLKASNSVRDLKGVEVEVEPPLPLSAASSPPQPPLTPSPVLSIQSSAGLPENQTHHLQPPPPPPPSSRTPALLPSLATVATTTSTTSSSSTSSSSSHIPINGEVIPSMYNAQQTSAPSYSGLVRAMSGSTPPAIDPISLSLSSSLYGASSFFQSAPQNTRSQPALSATALLQKAAQMGSSSSKSSFLQGLWLSDTQLNASPMDAMTSSTPGADCVKLERNSLATGLGLGLPSAGASGFSELMISPPTTLDFLGLGMPAGEASPDGFSAYFNSIGGRLHMAPAAAPFAPVRAAVADTWDEPAERKPSML